TDCEGRRRSQQFVERKGGPGNKGSRPRLTLERPPMSGIGAEWLRALVQKIPKSRRRRRAQERARRRRRLTLLRAAVWVASHQLDSKPPTRLHRALQDYRRSDPIGFMEEWLPVIMGVLSPTPPGMAIRVPGRACFWCGWPAMPSEMRCLR